MSESMTEYQKFLESKVKNVIDSVNGVEINSALFDFQKYIVERALKAGRFAIFADCGLGKTLMQLEWAQHVVDYTKAPVLILCPLAVAGQTIREGARFGYLVSRIIEDSVSIPGIYISNYDQLDNIDCSVFSGVVLDESGILKNYEGATKSLIIDRFVTTQYKLACTATPSPNDPMELGNHSEFLGAMSRAEMLAMYFVHDGGQTSKWRIKGHCQNIFWEWVSQWAIMLAKPSDIGFEAVGYDLPELNIIEKQIATKKRDNGTLFNDVAVSATGFNAELRITKVERLDQVAEIVNKSSDNFIVWIKQDEEADLLMKLIPDAVEVRGSQPVHIKEQRLLAFGNNEFRVLIGCEESQTVTKEFRALGHEAT